MAVGVAAAPPDSRCDKGLVLILLSTLFDDAVRGRSEKPDQWLAWGTAECRKAPIFGASKMSTWGFAEPWPYFLTLSAVSDSPSVGKCNNPPPPKTSTWAFVGPWPNFPTSGPEGLRWQRRRRAFGGRPRSRGVGGPLIVGCCAETRTVVKHQAQPPPHPTKRARRVPPRSAKNQPETA